MSNLGDSLKRRRKAKGLSQGEVAKAVGVSQRAYSLWEEGKRNPKMASVLLLDKVLGPEHSKTFVLGENESEEHLLKQLALGDINVTVADYIDLQKKLINLQERLTQRLLKEEEANSKKMDFYADEVLKNMRADHETILSALDRVLALPPGTLGKESDTRMPGALPVKKGTHSQKGVFDKKGKG